jgi:hypothetical protein
VEPSDTPDEPDSSESPDGADSTKTPVVATGGEPVGLSPAIGIGGLLLGLFGVGCYLRRRRAARR